MTIVYEISGKVRTIQEKDPKVARLLKETLEKLGFKAEIIGGADFTSNEHIESVVCPDRYCATTQY